MKNKISQDFLEVSFLLGKELLNKDSISEVEEEFLKHLDKLAELLTLQ